MRYTEGDLEAFVELIESRGWALLKVMISEQVAVELKLLRSAADMALVFKTQGKIVGLEKVLAMVTTAVTFADGVKRESPEVRFDSND